MAKMEWDIDEQILRVLHGESEPAERAALDEWIAASGEHECYFRKRMWEFRRIQTVVNRAETEEMKERIRANLQQSLWERNRKQQRLWQIGLIVAAVAVVAVGFGLSVWLRQGPAGQEIPMAQSVITPGKSVATITLTNGELVELGGRVSQSREENGTVVRMDSSTVTYEGQQCAPSETAYHTLAVPMGGEYQLVLSDSTKVWVNADSKLKYPVAFQGAQREVFLEGEAYFEVAKDCRHPFIVHTSRGMIKVLGTGFNVRDYREETRVVTTLVEGKVAYRQKERRQEVILSPGYQVEDYGQEEIEPREVDVEMYVSWKDGKYIFDDATLEEIMQVLAKWYDVAVFYRKEEMKLLHFTGDLERYDNINDFLHFMELGGKVTFHIQGKTIIVE